MKFTQIVTPLVGLLLTPTLALAQPQPAPAAPAPVAAPTAPVTATPAAPTPAVAPAPVAPGPVAGDATGVEPVATVAPADPLPTAAPAPSVTEPVAVEPASAEPPKPPNQLSVGKENGFFQPSALLQFWTTYSHQENVKDTFGFKLRRAELKFKGEIVPKKVGYQLMIDAAKYPKFKSVAVTDGNDAEVAVAQPDGTDQSMLQDFYITFMSEWADVSVGQFKTPIGLEALQSSSKLLFPERADAIRNLYGDKRDLGIRVDKKIGDHFYYQAALFNGSGQNTPEVDNDKQGGLRLEVYPIKEVTIGVVGFTTIGARETSTKDRVEGDLRYEGNGLIAQAEYHRGWDGDGAEGLPTVQGHGAYAAFGYTIADVLQPIARVGFVDANLSEDATNDMKTKYELGANYFIQAHEARVGLAAAFTDNEDPDVPLLSEVTLAAQVAF